jgi:hypothetical protein
LGSDYGAGVAWMVNLRDRAACTCTGSKKVRLPILKYGK